jgi:hypothetical protein
MAKRKTYTLEEWFDNAGGWKPRHDVEELKRGIEIGILDYQDYWGMTALHMAVASDWLAGVQELLRHGAKTETRYFRTGETPLYTLMLKIGRAKENPEIQVILEALLASGANPDAANYFGVTPRQWSEHGDTNWFADIPEKPPEMPEPRIQNAEHLADAHYPSFKIPKREERETMKVGQAVDLYVYGPRVEGKQDTVKVRITARSGRRPRVRYTAVVETPIERTNLAPDTTEVSFGPENIASVYVPRVAKKK